MGEASRRRRGRQQQQIPEERFGSGAFETALLDEGLAVAAQLAEQAIAAGEKYPNVVMALWGFVTPYLLGQGFSVEQLTTVIMDARKNSADA